MHRDPAVDDLVAPASKGPPIMELTELVGRDEQLIEITGQALVPSARVITITGPGGVGKSRLAAAAADQIRGYFANGTSMVDLSDLTDSGDVPAAITGALGLPDAAATAPRASQLWAPIADWELLLVLDGCERVVKGLAHVLRRLFAGAPRVRVLATSREPLRVYGERLVHVPPLPIPEQSAEVDLDELFEVPSVALFVERARAVNPTFTLTSENAAAVAEICILLDGLPVAIELVARRMRLFQVNALRARLRRGDDVLVGGHPDAPERHQSIHAVTEWSYQLLDPDLGDLLNQLAVCEGGFSVHTVEEMFEMPLVAAEQALESLVERNLILVQEQRDGEPRFAMLETIRRFCLRKLTASGTLAAARRRHAAYALKLADQLGPRLAGAQQAAALDHLALEHRNGQAALRYLADSGEWVDAARLALAVHPYWLIRGRLLDGLTWLDAVAAGCAGEAPELATAATAAAGQFAAALGDAGGALRRYERSLADSRQRGDDRGAAVAGADLGAALCRAGNVARGRTLLTGSIRMLHDLGDPAEPRAQLLLAEVVHAAGEQRLADSLVAEALEAYRARQDGFGAACAMRQLAVLTEGRGEREVADRLHRDSLRELRTVGAGPELATGLVEFALFVLRSRVGQEQRIVRLLAAADAIRRKAMIPLDERQRQLADDTRQEMIARLGGSRFESLWLEGHRVDSHSAVADALSTLPVRPDAAADPGRSRSLTPRQFQVAILVGQGLTNRQIAHRLDLSEWTVVNHVRQIMRKLGAPSRVHVARWVSKQG
jgi:predicted ATPase/DNA-binding CsgD family transcriptional regulator